MALLIEFCFQLETMKSFTRYISDNFVGYSVSCMTLFVAKKEIQKNQIASESPAYLFE